MSRTTYMSLYPSPRHSEPKNTPWSFFMARTKTRINNCLNILPTLRNNPNSLATIESTPENQFKRVFICYGASAMGIGHCRPLLGLDGTHLKTRYQGILLAATGVDAHGQLFPLAWAVVDGENNDNWLWMLRLLRQVLEQSAPHFLEPTVIPFVYVFNLETHFALRQTKGTHRRCRSSLSNQSTWLLHASSCRKLP